MRANERQGDWPSDQSEAGAQVTGPEYRWLVNSGSGFTVDILTGSKIFFGREGFYCMKLYTILNNPLK